MYNKIIEELEAEKKLHNDNYDHFDNGARCALDEAIQIVRKHAEIQEKVNADLLKRGEDIEAMHPYKIVGNHDTYSQYNEGWSDCADLYLQLIEEINKPH